MKIFFDVEFYENGRNIYLISIGMVTETGLKYYAELEDAQGWCKSDWLKQNVLPHLTGVQTSHLNVRKQIIDFVGEKPEFWAYYADYDWVVLCQLFGTMMDLPKGWPMFCMDVKQLCVMVGDPELPKQTSVEHHALNDALWTKGGLGVFDGETIRSKLCQGE